MKRAIEFKEVIEKRYRAVVDVPDQETLERINQMKGEDFDEIMVQIRNTEGTEVIDSDDDFDQIVLCPMTYADDYWTDTEEEDYT